MWRGVDIPCCPWLQDLTPQVVSWRRATDVFFRPQHQALWPDGQAGVLGDTTHAFGLMRCFMLLYLICLQKKAGIWNLFKYQYYGGPQRRREPKFWFSSGISSFVKKDHRNPLQSLVPSCCIQKLMFLFFFTWNPYFHRSVCWFWFHPSKASDDLGTLLRSKFCEPKPLLHAGSLRAKRGAGSR